MSKINNAKALALGQGLSVLTSLLLLPYLSRSLSVDIYGSYGQVLFYVDVFKAFALLGLNKVVFIYISKNTNLQEVYSNNIFASFFAGLALAIICAMTSIFIANLFDNPLLVFPICIYSISIPFNTCFTCYSSLLVNEGKSKLLSWISILTNLFRAFVLLIIIQYMQSLIYIFIGLAVLSILQWFCIVYFSKIKVDRTLVKLKSWTTQIKEGLPLGLTSIMGTLYYLTDSFVVSSILTSQDYAILRNGAFQIPFISTLYSIIGLVLMKDLGAHLLKKDFKSVINLKSRAIIVSCVVVFPVTIFLIVFAKFWIPFLFSSLYQGSVIIFMIYNIMTLFRITSYENIIVLSEKGHKLPLIYVGSFLANLILSIPLTYLYGPGGSAVASIISFLFLITLLTRINLDLLNAKISDFISLKQVLLIALPSLILSVIPYVYFNFYTVSHISIWISVVLIGALLALTYHIILKSKVVSSSDIQSLLQIIPIPIIQKYLKHQYCE